MAPKTRTTPDVNKADCVAKCALLFEMENLAASGRSVLFDVLKSVFAERGAEVSRALFARFCLDAPPAVFVPQLLSQTKKERVSVAKLLSEVLDGTDLSFREGNVSLGKELGKLIADARGHGWEVGCLSALKQETATVLAERLGLPALNVKVMPHANDHKRFPSPDEWLKLAKLVGVPPKHCVALVSGSLATHSALSAGMRVAALPDKFTAFQDCTGADFVCETPGDLPFKELSVICGA